MRRLLQKTRDFAKCLFGIHCVPKNWAYEYMAAICAGGVCPRCGRIKWGKFICNTWTEEDARPNGTVLLKGYDVSRATAQGYEIRGDIDDLYEEYWERKRKKATAR